MLKWLVEVTEDRRRVGRFDLPGHTEKPRIVDLLRLLTAKSLTLDEIVRQPELLEVAEHDKGRTLTCGDGLVVVTARQMWHPSTKDGRDEQ